MIFLMANRVILFNTSKKDNIIVVFTVGINKFDYNIDKHTARGPQRHNRDIFFMMS